MSWVFNLDLIWFSRWRWLGQQTLALSTWIFENDHDEVAWSIQRCCGDFLEFFPEILAVGQDARLDTKVIETRSMPDVDVSHAQFSHWNFSNFLRQGPRLLPDVWVATGVGRQPQDFLFRSRDADFFGRLDIAEFLGPTSSSVLRTLTLLGVSDENGWMRTDWQPSDLGLFGAILCTLVHFPHKIFRLYRIWVRLFPKRPKWQILIVEFCQRSSGSSDTDFDVM